jgi:hypothetical protein
LKQFVEHQVLQNVVNKKERRGNFNMGEGFEDN